MNEVRSKESVIAVWARDAGQAVDRAGAAAIEQFTAAKEDAPSYAEDVDSWFEEHFHKAPISHDTALYNALHAAKEELKKLLAGE